MANFPKLKLTNRGLTLLTNVQAGEDDLIFTRISIGDGELSTPMASLSALVSPKVNINITEGKHVGTATYQIGGFFSNNDTAIGFWWREVGVFAKGKDGTEILYAYSNAGDAGDYIPTGNDERVEKYIYLSLSIGNAENVTVEVTANDTFILKSDIGEVGGVVPLNSSKKIDVTYLPDINSSYVGLGNVPNVSTNDQTPTYSEALTLTNIVSGEKLGIAFGKIKKAITDLIAHIADSTKHITAAERTTWNGKAQTNHASTATTYGVGTASNYGHLKITDSKASTATDTAASAKALKETYDLVDKSRYKLLKTIDTTVNLQTAKGSIQYMHIPFTGVDLEVYEEIRVFVNGNISLNKAEQATNTYNDFSIYVSNGTNSRDGLYRMFFFHQHYGAPAISFRIDEAFATLYPLLEYETQTQYETSTIITNKNKNWFTMKSIGTNNPYVSDVGKEIFVSAMYQNNVNNSTATATGSLTISIYGKEMVKP